MEMLILWSGFLGSWLLFAGPVYQAALELTDEDIALERIREVRHIVTKLPEVSALWWFLPPLKLYLEHRRSDQYRKRFFAALPPEDAETLLSFFNKSTSWLIVAAGGLLLAIQETYELCSGLRIEGVWFWAIVFVLLFVSVLYTVLQIRHTNKLKEKYSINPSAE